MSENFQSKFTLNGIVQTKDGYRINLIGIINSNQLIDPSKVNALISGPSIKYFSEYSLIDTLNIVEKGEYGKLRDEVISYSSEKGFPITSFDIHTLDAKYTEEDSSLELDPNLEASGKKRKGLLGKLFGKK